jgi:hypothetical protein
MVKAVQVVAGPTESAGAKAAPIASATTKGDGPVLTDAESCTDYCPNPACACRVRVIAGCSLPLRSTQPPSSAADKDGTAHE